MRTRLRIFAAFAALLAVACTVPNPDYRPPGRDASDGASACRRDEALRCDGNALVLCNGDGTAEVRETCPLGCNAAAVRCAEFVPSNELAKYMRLARNQPDLTLSGSATMNTDNGDVSVGGEVVGVTSDVVTQSGGRNIRVYIVRSLTTSDVVVVGTNAVAVVSHGDININGLFSASANNDGPGAGAYNEDACTGKNPQVGALGQSGGFGGGGFGTRGGAGGAGAGVTGGAGGAPSGNAALVPLRGGCDGGNQPYMGRYAGGAGGAIQFSSRTAIAVKGTVAANGSGGFGGGSGGGILLEAPTVDVLGAVVANGGGGGGQGGRLDATPAVGRAAEVIGSTTVTGAGGNGAAGSTPAVAGSNGYNSGNRSGRGGDGGGGVGRIRINTASGSRRMTGVVSPDATESTLATDVGT